MIKRVLLIGGVVVVVVAVCFGSTAVSYLRTSAHYVSESVQGAVPIEFQIDRARQMVADLEPVFLAGSTISRATLHNANEIARKDIREGDTVLIEKGGDVIPKVAEVVTDKRPAVSVPYTMPDRCPSFDTPLSPVSNRETCPRPVTQR